MQRPRIGLMSWRISRSTKMQSTTLSQNSWIQRDNIKSKNCNQSFESWPTIEEKSRNSKPTTVIQCRQRMGVWIQHTILVIVIITIVPVITHRHRSPSYYVIEPASAKMSCGQSPNLSEQGHQNLLKASLCKIHTNLDTCASPSLDVRGSGLQAPSNMVAFIATS